MKASSAKSTTDNSRGHADLFALQSGAGGNRGGVRRVPVHDQPCDHSDYALLNKKLRLFVLTADELDDKTQYVVDGTLLPCWSWVSHPQLYSGKHKTTGMNVQVAATLGGRLAWISDPIDGNRHDSHCLVEAAVLTGMDAGNWMGDKGYTGNNMITPIKKSPYRDLLDWEKEFNTQVNKIRWIIEQVIAHLKTWRILDTDYRRPIGTFPETISVVIVLHFWRSA